MTGKTFFSKMLASAAIITFGSASAQAQKSNVPKTITVTGSVQFIDPKGNNKIWLYKEKMYGKEQAVDSVTVSEQNKHFTFKLRQDHPGIYHIDALQWDRAYFWSDADVNVNMRGYDTGRYHMKIPHYNFVEGSMDNNFINLYEQINQLDYLRMVDEYNEEYYANEYKKTDSAWIAYLKTRPRYDSMRVDYKKRKEVLMNVFKDRPVLLYALRENIGPESSDKYDSVMKTLDNLGRKYPWLTEAKEAKETIITNREMASKVRAGKPVPSISYPNASGSLKGLESYKGKYLLIDFWASWCGPCRQAIPKVKELYKEYHDKGFDVLSVSIDTDKKAWEKAMGEENMPWEQLLSPDKDKTMKQFQFSGIPTLYFIDPTGKIIKTFSGFGPDTETEIKSMLANKTVAPSAEQTSIPAASF